jgi:hypothetical protein
MIEGVGRAQGIHVDFLSMSEAGKLRIARKHRAEASLVNLRQIKILGGIFHLKNKTKISTRML